MKKHLLLFLLFVANYFVAFSQTKNLQGIVLSGKDSLPVVSALVIIRDFLSYEESHNNDSIKNTLYVTHTDSLGRFVFKDVLISPILTPYQDGNYVRIEILCNRFETGINSLYVNDDSIRTFYLMPFSVIQPEDKIVVPTKPTPYKQYSTSLFFSGTQFSGSDIYRFNYKTGVSILNNYKISPFNYFGFEVNPLIFRRYDTKHDTVNTPTVYQREFFLTIQSGIGVYLRTHLLSWSEKKNALFFDVGAEYDYPWYYQYVNKPDKYSNVSLRNFHKRNEFYANARIGILKWFTLKGQYRMTDIFTNQFTELPRWSAELQVVFMLSGY